MTATDPIGDYQRQFLLAGWEACCARSSLLAAQERMTRAKQAEDASQLAYEAAVRQNKQPKGDV